MIDHFILLKVLWKTRQDANDTYVCMIYLFAISNPSFSGMGEAYLFRKRFEEAQEMMRQQDDWCDTAMRLNKTQHNASPPETRLSEPFPESLKLDSLVALLRHNVKLNIHCYLPQDIEAIVRHSLEFDFEIAALHHASSAWQVPDIIKRAKNNITVATSTGNLKHICIAIQANHPIIL